MAIGGMIVGKTFVTLMVNGTTHSITESHPNYEQIREAVRAKDMDLVESLVNVAKSITNYMSGRVRVTDGQVFYGSEEVKGPLVDRILDMLHEGFDAGPMCVFLDNLMLNPSKRAVDELYGFLEDCSLPITEDGHFLAYKKVREDYRDFYTGTMDNSVGQILEMPRNRVDENKDRTCSEGLHFCSMSYLSAYHSGKGRVVLVKINPRDVVSIPSDYNNAKGRACRYEIIADHTSEVESAFDKPVYSNKYFEDSEHNWLDDEQESYDDWEVEVDEEEEDLESDDLDLAGTTSAWSWGFHNGRTDADAGKPYNDLPSAHAICVSDVETYRRAYAKGFKSI